MSKNKEYVKIRCFGLNGRGRYPKGNVANNAGFVAGRSKVKFSLARQKLRAEHERILKEKRHQAVLLEAERLAKMTSEEVFVETHKMHPAKFNILAKKFTALFGETGGLAAGQRPEYIAVRLMERRTPDESVPFTFKDANAFAQWAVYRREIINLIKLKKE